MALKPKYLSREIPDNVTPKTTKPAIKQPELIAKNDFLNEMPKIQLAKQAVQTPVLGKGMPTNRAKPTKPYFSIYFLVFRPAFWVDQLKIKARAFDCWLDQAISGFKNKSKNKAKRTSGKIEKITTKKGFSL